MKRINTGQAMPFIALVEADEEDGTEEVPF